jgi:hypothetical protein
MSTNRVLRFETNVPVQLALQTVDGLRVGSAGKWQMLFVTVSGLRVYFDEATAATIKRIVKSDEPFMVCKRRGKFDVWLSNQAERARAAEEAPEVARQLKSAWVKDPGPPYLPHVEPSPVIPFPAPPTRQEEKEPLRPTGTDCTPVLAPVAQARPFLASSRPAPPGRVGYGAALRDICKTVKSVLCETGLVLGDSPTQDLISTVFIAAQKEKAVDFDFGEAA